MKKYTPGPWKVCHRRADVSRMETNEIHYGNDTECIAEYVADDNDAQLIAAAPDLAEALEAFAGGECEKECECVSVLSTEKYIPCKYCRARVALKKAGVIS